MKKIYIVLLLVLLNILHANNVIEEQKLCANGDHNACFSLGQKYAEGITVKKNLTKASELYDKACIGGNDGGCFNLAVAYRNGQGVKKNYAKSVNLYQKACDMGASDGCANLAFMYTEGLGVDKNRLKSIKFAKKSCDLGNVGGCYNLSLQYIDQRNFKKAREVSIIACNQEHAGACFNLGLMYVNGDGIEKNNENAYKYFSKACDRGSKKGCEYAKSNFITQHTGGDTNIFLDDGFGSEYRNDVQTAKVFLLNKEFDKAMKILDTVTNAIESKYLKKDSIFLSMKTQKEFNEYVKLNKLQNVIWLDFTYRDAYYWKSFIFIDRQQYQNAIGILKKLTFISPNDSHIYTEMGGIYNKTGRADIGLIKYQDAYVIAKKYGQRMGVSLRGMGFSYIELGQFSKAKEAYQMSLMVEPDNKIAIDELTYIESLNK